MAYKTATQTKTISKTKMAVAVGFLAVGAIAAAAAGGIRVRPTPTKPLPAYDETKKSKRTGADQVTEPTAAETAESPSSPPATTSTVSTIETKQFCKKNASTDLLICQKRFEALPQIPKSAWQYFLNTYSCAGLYRGMPILKVNEKYTTLTWDATGKVLVGYLFNGCSIDPQPQVQTLKNAQKCIDELKNDFKNQLLYLDEAVCPAPEPPSLSFSSFEEVKILSEGSQLAVVSEEKYTSDEIFFPFTVTAPPVESPSRLSSVTYTIELFKIGGMSAVGDWKGKAEEFIEYKGMQPFTAKDPTGKIIDSITVLTGIWSNSGGKIWVPVVLTLDQEKNKFVGKATFDLDVLASQISDFAPAFTKKYNFRLHISKSKQNDKIFGEDCVKGCNPVGVLRVRLFPEDVVVKDDDGNVVTNVTGLPKEYLFDLNRK